MLTFNKWIKIFGYASGILLLLVFAIVFVDMVSKETSVNEVVKVKNKAQASSVDIWRVSAKYKRRYRLMAASMDKKKNGVVILHKAQLWCFEEGSPTVYLKADTAIIYVNNDVKAQGHVYLKRNDLKIFAKSVKWYDNSKIIESKYPFRGCSEKSSFSGKNFIYYQNKDYLVVLGVDIWLKQNS